uniref:ShKT domain-containing protein n=1 Tax=Meloidogyne floridensis TaxID=298350 RepID=A0A915NE33_9BILA
MFLTINYFLLIFNTNLLILGSVAELAPCVEGECPELYGPCSGKLENGETPPNNSGNPANSGNSGNGVTPKNGGNSQTSSVCKDIGKGCQLITSLYKAAGRPCSSSVSLICASTCNV